MDMTLELLKQAVVKMVTVCGECNSEGRFACRMDTKVREVGVKRWLAATKADAKCPVGVKFEKPRCDPIKG